MRIWSLTAAVILTLIQASTATGQDNNPLLEGAQKFCAAKYGDRLLGVTVDGKNGFSCRFAAIARTESFKIASSGEDAEAQPVWDLDEEEDPGASQSSGATAAPQTTASITPDSSERNAATALPGVVKVSPGAKPRKASKRRYRKRRYRKRRYRRRNRDPFAAMFRNVRRASSRRKYRRRYVRRRYRTNIRRHR